MRRPRSTRPQRCYLERAGEGYKIPKIELAITGVVPGSLGRRILNLRKTSGGIVSDQQRAARGTDQRFAPTLAS